MDVLLLMLLIYRIKLNPVDATKVLIGLLFISKNKIQMFFPSVSSTGSGIIGILLSKFVKLIVKACPYQKAAYLR